MDCGLSFVVESGRTCIQAEPFQEELARGLGLSWPMEGDTKVQAARQGLALLGESWTTLTLWLVPTPRLGTFRHVWLASRNSIYGITSCCIIVYFCLLALSSLHEFRLLTNRTFCNQQGLQQLVNTGFFELLANSVTAPVLIYRGWRKEPYRHTIDGGNWFRRRADDESTITFEDHEGHPCLIMERDCSTERELLVNELVQIRYDMEEDPQLRWRWQMLKVSAWVLGVVALVVTYWELVQRTVSDRLEFCFKDYVIT